MNLFSWKLDGTLPLKVSLLGLLLFWILLFNETFALKATSYMRNLNSFKGLSSVSISKLKAPRYNPLYMQLNKNLVNPFFSNNFITCSQKSFLQSSCFLFELCATSKLLFVGLPSLKNLKPFHRLTTVPLIYSFSSGISLISDKRALSYFVSSCNMEDMHDKEKKPLVVFVLGGPGSGKGTQCKNIADTYRFIHISAGDCLREEQVIPGSQYGETIAKAIKEGAIVPAQITIMLMRKKMVKSGWEKCRFLIDGFPRNQDNLDEWLRVMANDVDMRFCLFLDCPETEMAARLLSRAKESGRTDDNLVTIEKRFNLYNKETSQIIRWFESRNKTKHVDASGTREDVWQQLQTIFGDL
ncbi:UMP-CMP kinase [Cardiosporidium cionae]|uniref:UMP-CMP kinase n=1 Tax=Cardiosporidium cionae TaxID=476202 RepID=A0ABQ7J983_9APIC|nr:UMP-CMP kinase [Cardiosporidium cionae]|eukprot:KAF8820567.1 UMP-CMP kinase [Cardiosporidium cionae]